MPRAAGSAERMFSRSPRTKLRVGAQEKQERVGTYSLASLMMFMTLASVVCGAFSIAPGLAIVLIGMAVPAFVRTLILIRQKRGLGQQPHAGERALLFATSMGVVIVAGFAAVIAFYATCWGGFGATLGAGELWGIRGYGVLSWGLGLGVCLGSIVGLYVGYRVFIRLSRGAAKLPGRSRLILAIALFVAIAVAIIGVSVMINWDWW